MTKFIEVPASKTSLSMRSLSYGVAVNDALYMVHVKGVDGKQVSCPFYRVWHSMIQRCYSHIYLKNKPSYADCYVHEEWLKFTKFKFWMEKQNWEGKQLDKDIKVIGNKLYSPKTCLFVTGKINNLFMDTAAARGRHPIGVCFHKDTNKFQASCGLNGKQKHIGIFSTPEEAHAAYRLEKKKIVEDTANLPENEYIREYLLNHAALLKE